MLDGRVLEMVGLDAASDAIAGDGPFRTLGRVAMPPYAARWLVAAEGG